MITGSNTNSYLEPSSVHHGQSSCTHAHTFMVHSCMAVLSCVAPQLHEPRCWTNPPFPGYATRGPCCSLTEWTGSFFLVHLLFSKRHMHLPPRYVCPPRPELCLHDNILSLLEVRRYTEVLDAPLQLHPIYCIPCWELCTFPSLPLYTCAQLPRNPSLTHWLYPSLEAIGILQAQLTPCSTLYHSRHQFVELNRIQKCNVLLWLFCFVCFVLFCFVFISLGDFKFSLCSIFFLFLLDMLFIYISNVIPFPSSTPLPRNLLCYPPCFLHLLTQSLLPSNPLSNLHRTKDLTRPSSATYAAGTMSTPWLVS